MDRLLVGVDGGGTCCRARVRTLDGRLVGEAEGGAANLFTAPEAAGRNIVDVVQTALTSGGMHVDDMARCHVGLGLAGANIPSVLVGVDDLDLPFASYSVEVDSIVACRGAFPRTDGAVAILGTGTAYALRVAGRTRVLGGMGMLLSDQGSGADLGRRALQAALLAFDGVLPDDALCREILERFDRDPTAIVEFGRTALPGDFGRFSPLIWAHADKGDEVANRLIDEGLVWIARMISRLHELGAPSVALLGGLAHLYRPRLPTSLTALLVDPQGDAMEGALDLARESLAANHGRLTSA